ncbi:hypothetical protein PFISCL1PPCAC_17360, partial [Pristionchus fissidentatus]
MNSIGLGMRGGVIAASGTLLAAEDLVEQLALRVDSLETQPEYGSVPVRLGNPDADDRAVGVATLLQQLQLAIRELSRELGGDAQRRLGCEHGRAVGHLGARNAHHFSQFHEQHSRRLLIPIKQPSPLELASARLLLRLLHNDDAAVIRARRLREAHVLFECAQRAQQLVVRDRRHDRHGSCSRRVHHTDQHRATKAGEFYALRVVERPLAHLVHVHPRVHLRKQLLRLLLRARFVREEGALNVRVCDRGLGSRTAQVRLLMLRTIVGHNLHPLADAPLVELYRVQLVVLVVRNAIQLRQISHARCGGRLVVHAHLLLHARVAARPRCRAQLLLRERVEGDYVVRVRPIVEWRRGLLAAAHGVWRGQRGAEVEHALRRSADRRRRRLGNAATGVVEVHRVHLVVYRVVQSYRVRNRVPRLSRGTRQIRRLVLLDGAPEPLECTRPRRLLGRRKPVIGCLFAPHRLPSRSRGRRSTSFTAVRLTSLIFHGGVRLPRESSEYVVALGIVRSGGTGRRADGIVALRVELRWRLQHRQRESDSSLVSIMGCKVGLRSTSGVAGPITSLSQLTPHHPLVLRHKAAHVAVVVLLHFRIAKADHDGLPHFLFLRHHVQIVNSPLRDSRNVHVVNGGRTSSFGHNV